MDIHGQRVVVVGETSGIGLAVAAALTGRGADVVVASGRQSSVDAALSQLGPRASGTTVAVTDPGEVTRFFDGIGAFGHLVYTAGEALSLMPVAELDLERARAFFQTRYFGALTVVHAAAPRLRPGGSITLTSGSAGDRPGPGWALAASVCGAKNALTRALAVELAPIRVNAVAPGVVRSPLLSGMPDADRAAMYDEVGRSLPVGRVGEVGDVAEAYVYCMTQPYGTGTVINVDGGALLV
jgi:NAD(P)-dependent dehydrogenase (short-subunit alcohol dehydrogenase family)